MSNLKLLSNTLHLTVSHNGRVSLWDSEQSAQQGGVHWGEKYVPFQVDQELLIRIIFAALLATDNDEGWAG